MQFLLLIALALRRAEGGGETSLLQTGTSGRLQQELTVRCADSDSHCEYWAGQGWCQGTYASHVTGKCQASCGLCGGGGSTSGSSPSSTPSSTAAPATNSTQGSGASTGNTNAALASAIELANLINAYRMQNGKAAVPLSPAMMSSASVHVKDLILNTPGVPVSASQPDPCSLHSWSQLSPDSPGCCYKLSNPDGDCMWEKPKEHTTCWAQQYPGRGYENAWGPTQVTPQKCIDAWKNSEHHNDVMLNLGVWSGVSFNPWPAMGVAIEGDYCVLWMGDAEDPAGTFTAEKASSHECCMPSQYCPSF